MAYGGHFPPICWQYHDTAGLALFLSYRDGAALRIQRAIMAGMREAGACVFRLVGKPRCRAGMRTTAVPIGPMTATGESFLTSWLATATPRREALGTFKGRGQANAHSLLKGDNRSTNPPDDVELPSPLLPRRSTASSGCPPLLGHVG